MDNRAHRTSRGARGAQSARRAPLAGRSLAALDYPCYSARLIRPFLRLLERFEGVQAFDELEALNVDDRAPIALAHQLLESAVERTGEVDIGLKAARLMSKGDGGAFDYAISSAATLGDSLEIAARYTALINDALDLRVELEGGRALLRMDSQVVLPKAAEDFILGTFYACHLRDQLGQAPELECRFTQPSPDDQSEYERSFAPASLRFAAQHRGFAFDAVRLSTPLASADGKLHVIVCKHAEQLLAELPKAESLTEKVRVLIAQELPHVQPSVTHVARLLRMTPRTLGRRLEDEGTTFRSLLDELRRRLAVQYLGTPQIALAEVAFLLGFSEAAAFHRAFKRWTGQTPLEFRREVSARGGTRRPAPTK